MKHIYSTGVIYDCHLRSSKYLYNTGHGWIVNLEWNQTHFMTNVLIKSIFWNFTKNCFFLGKYFLPNLIFVQSSSMFALPENSLFNPIYVRCKSIERFQKKQPNLSVFESHGDKHTVFYWVQCTPEFLNDFWQKKLFLFFNNNFTRINHFKFIQYKSHHKPFLSYLPCVVCREYFSIIFNVKKC